MRGGGGCNDGLHLNDGVDPNDRFQRSAANAAAIGLERYVIRSRRNLRKAHFHVVGVRSSKESSRHLHALFRRGAESWSAFADPEAPSTRELTTRRWFAAENARDLIECDAEDIM